MRFCPRHSALTLFWKTFYASFANLSMQCNMDGLLRYLKKITKKKSKQKLIPMLTHACMFMSCLPVLLRRWNKKNPSFCSLCLENRDLFEPQHRSIMLVLPRNQVYFVEKKGIVIVHWLLSSYIILHPIKNVIISLKKSTKECNPRK
jgi:hypothetical protein